VKTIVALRESGKKNIVRKTVVEDGFGVASAALCAVGAHNCVSLEASPQKHFRGKVLDTRHTFLSLSLPVQRDCARTVLNER
jgi:hypothetical protein